MSEGNVAADQLRLFIERIERLEEEKKGIADDVKDVYAEAKANGYDTKTMRAIVRLRRMETHVAQKKGPKVILAPVFSMVDRRRGLHQQELAGQPGWPVIPMASAYERMSLERSPVGELFPASNPAVQAVAEVWRRIEKALAK